MALPQHHSHLRAALSVATGSSEAQTDLDDEGAPLTWTYSRNDLDQLVDTLWAFSKVPSTFAKLARCGVSSGFPYRSLDGMFISLLSSNTVYIDIFLESFAFLVASREAKKAVQDLEKCAFCARVIPETGRLDHIGRHLLPLSGETVEKEDRAAVRTLSAQLLTYLLLARWLLGIGAASVGAPTTPFASNSCSRSRLDKARRRFCRRARHSLQLAMGAHPSLQVLARAPTCLSSASSAFRILIETSPSLAWQGGSTTWMLIFVVLIRATRRRVAPLAISSQSRWQSLSISGLRRKSG